VHPAILNLAERVALFSSVKALTSTTEPVPVGLSTFNETVRRFGSLAVQKGLTFEAADLPAVRVLGDTKLLQLLLEEVLGNSLHYTRAGGVVVEVADAPDFVEVSVRDTGVGVTAGEIEHLCDEFFRGVQAKQLYPQGTGLGLTIAREIVQWCGGSIRVEGCACQGLRVQINLRKEVRSGSNTDRGG